MRYAITLFAVTAAAFRAQDCRDAYDACKAAGTPDITCACQQTACLGEDNERNRVYCSSAIAALPSSTSAASAEPTYACSPGHQYPNGEQCVSISGTLALVTATSAPPAEQTYACSPAHQYPNGEQCVSISGTLALVTPTATPIYANAPPVSFTASATGAAPTWTNAAPVSFTASSSGAAPTWANVPPVSFYPQPSVSAGNSTGGGNGTIVHYTGAASKPMATGAAMLVGLGALLF